MGEKVRVGKFTYDVIESNSKTQLPATPTPRVPERNFLLLRVSITNGGGQEKVAPSMFLENSSGDTFPEIPNGAGIDNWLGLLRKVPPAQTDEGWILFDVPTDSYRLKIVEADDAGNETAVYVRIPLKLPESS